jgi:hypothetical protein
MKEKRGPKIDPWGIPHMTVKVDDLQITNELIRQFKRNRYFFHSQIELI